MPITCAKVFDYAVPVFAIGSSQYAYELNATRRAARTNSPTIFAASVAFEAEDHSAVSSFGLVNVNRLRDVLCMHK